MLKMKNKKIIPLDPDTGKPIKKKKTKYGAYKKPRMKFLQKPINKNDWEKNWNPILTDFAIGFDHNVAAFDYENLNDMTVQDWYLAGIARGMFSMIEMIEERIVRGENKKWKSKKQ